MEKSHDDHRRGPHRDRQPRSANPVPRSFAVSTCGSPRRSRRRRAAVSTEGFSIPPSARRTSARPDQLAQRSSRSSSTRVNSAQDRPARADADDPVRREAQTELLHRPQGRPAGLQPSRRRDDPPRAQDAGVTLVSATENIDETPSGMLLHGIMSSIAEFYSRNLATEVVKGCRRRRRRAAP